MKKQFAVIGLGRFGSEVARILSENKHSVIAVDRSENKVKAVADQVSLAVQLDATDEKALREAGVQNVDIAVVSIGENIEASILVVMILKDLGIKNIIAKAISELHGRVLMQLGIRKVVHPERDMAQKVAMNLIRPEIFELIELSPEYSIVELPAPEFIHGKKILDANLRARHGITIIAIQHARDKDQDAPSWTINPFPSEVINKGESIVILGSNKEIENFRKLK